MGKPASDSCVCMGCGQTKECHTGRFGKSAGGKTVVRMSEMNRNVLWGSTMTCSMCDDCIGKTGRGYSWIWWVLGISFLFIGFGIYDMTVASGPDMPIGFPLILAGWILSIIGVTSGLSKLLGHKEGKISGAMLIGLFFGWTQIPTIILLILNKKIRRVAWVDKRLKDTANLIANDQDIRNKQLFAGIAAKDPASLKPEEKKMLEDKQRQDRMMEAQSAEIQHRESKNKYRGAIIGIVITFIIAVAGLSTYNSGGYMTWFGIELSTGGFIVLVGAFLVYDVLAIVFARRKVRQSELKVTDSSNTNLNSGNR